MHSRSKDAPDSEPVPVPGQHLSWVTRYYWRLRSLRDPAQVILSAALTVCVTVASMHSFAELATWPTLLWPVGVLFVAVIWAFGYFKWFKPTYSELEQQKERALADLVTAREAAVAEVDEHRRALQGALDTLLAELGGYICGDSVDTRVSVYSVEDDEFVLLARHSENPNLERRGRSSYPLTQGAIGVAWGRRSFIDNSEEDDREAWKRNLRAQGFSAEDVEGLKMYTRCIYAQRLDRGNIKAGVVVFECEAPNRFDSKTMSKVSKSRLHNALAVLVSASHGHFPRVKERESERQGIEAPALVPEPVWKRADPVNRAEVQVASE